MAVTRRGRLTRRGRRLVRLLVLLVVLLLVLVLLVVAVARSPWRSWLGLGLDDGPPCTLTTATTGGDREWSRVEAMTATTVTGVGVRIKASENGVAAAVRRALAVPRDVPITPAEARQVYRALPDVARPDTDAIEMARALLGNHGPALTCRAASDAPSLRPQGLGTDGLTPRAEALRVGMREVFGRQSLGGFAAGGVRSGHTPGSAHYDGRAVDVFFRPVSVAKTRHGWTLAMWAVAHSVRLHLATVIFDRKVWANGSSDLGWHDYRYPGGATENPILLHEDHVHLDVLRGG